MTSYSLGWPLFKQQQHKTSTDEDTGKLVLVHQWKCEIAQPL